MADVNFNEMTNDELLREAYANHANSPLMQELAARLDALDIPQEK